MPEVLADRSLLAQVFTNLLSNAFKFTRHKERALIEVRSRRDNDANVFLVRDNGVGFDMRFAAKLFAPFQRLHVQEEFPGRVSGCLSSNASCGVTADAFGPRPRSTKARRLVSRFQTESETSPNHATSTSRS